MCPVCASSTTKQFILTPSTWQPHPRCAGLSASNLAPPRLQMPSPGLLTTLSLGRRSIWLPSAPVYYTECSPGTARWWRFMWGGAWGISAPWAPQSPLAPRPGTPSFRAFMDASLHRHGCLDLWWTKLNFVLRWIQNFGWTQSPVPPFSLPWSLGGGWRRAGRSINFSSLILWLVPRQPATPKVSKGLLKVTSLA